MSEKARPTPQEGDLVYEEIRFKFSYWTSGSVHCLLLKPPERRVQDSSAFVCEGYILIIFRIFYHITDIEKVAGNFLEHTTRYCSALDSGNFSSSPESSCPVALPRSTDEAR